MSNIDIANENRIWEIVVRRRREVPPGFVLAGDVCPGCYEHVKVTGPRRQAPAGQLWHVGCFYETGLPLWEAEAKRWGYRYETD
jgi:hypothetical protein